MFFSPCCGTLDYLFLPASMTYVDCGASGVWSVELCVIGYLVSAKVDFYVVRFRSLGLWIPCFLFVTDSFCNLYRRCRAAG